MTQDVSDDPLIVLYGTLRRGQPPYDRLGLESRLRFVGPCMLKGILYDLGSYPGLIMGNNVVTGELFAVPEPKTLEELDAYEGCDHLNPERGLYIRRAVTLLQPSNTTAFVYFYNHDIAGHSIISDGDWVKHHTRKEKI